VRKLNETPRGSRLHIALLGRRNAGKSSIINALTNQALAIVSDVPGTTTDPVYKAMEILPIGPVVIIDTAGLDDVGELGELRRQKSLAVLAKADVAVLVVDSLVGWTEFEQKVVDSCQERGVPVVAVLNKSDLMSTPPVCPDSRLAAVIQTSAVTGQGIEELKLALVKATPANWDSQPLVGDLLQRGDIVVLVVPIDTAAPKGRLILPQVQTIRDILDHEAVAVVVKENQLEQVFNSLSCKPKLVITDSQAFEQVVAVTPPDILLTSFSILFARYKGDLATFVEGARALKTLRPGDKVLISEACTHHRQEDDIATKKIPRWLNHFVGGELSFSWSSGGEFPENLAEYKVIIHCGGCMINRREMLARLMRARQAGVPIVNYGVAIAALHGILGRALSPFPELYAVYNEGVD